jgi:transposase
MAIDDKTEALVYYLSRFQGLSIRQVAKEYNVSRSIMWRISKMDMSSNGCKKMRRETRGRPRKLNKREERKLYDD